MTDDRRAQKPLPGEMSAMVMTQPFVMAKVKKEKGIKKVEFVDPAGRALYSTSVSEQILCKSSNGSKQKV